MEDGKNSGMKRKAEIVVFAGAVLVALGWWFLASGDRKADAAEPVRAKSRLIAEAKPRIANAKAAEDLAVPDDEPPESAQEPLFSVGGRRYRSLAEAVAAAEPGSTITLEGDAYLRDPVAIMKDIRIDLGGFRLTARNSRGRRSGHSGGDFVRSSHAIAIVGDHDVTIENGFIDVPVEKNGGGGFSGAVEKVIDPNAEANLHPDDKNFDVVLRDLTVNNEVRRDAAFINAEGRMLVDNCTVSSDGGCGVYTVGANSSTTIRDCAFTTVGQEGNGMWWNSTVAAAFDGTVIVESGDYVSQMAEGAEGTAYGAYVFSSGGTIEIKDGNFVADKVLKTDKDMTNYKDYGAAEVVVKDGAFSGKIDGKAWGEGAEGMSGSSTYGGVYDNAPAAENVPEGKAVVDYGDGTYSVEDKR